MCSLSTLTMATARYHHGNLRAALLDAGLSLAAKNGPMSLQVRDLAKAEGVSASAVYRHFPDLAHLAADVSRLARERLAQSMLDAANTIAPQSDPGMYAIRRFDAIGLAYVQFAVDEPNLFDVAFQAPTAPPSHADDPSAWDVLTDALDAIVAAGEMSLERRADAPMIAWSAVHGLASILVRQMMPSPDERRAATVAVMRGVRRALALRDDAATAP
jgi:AcrR family transcriptional regulator